MARILVADDNSNIQKMVALALQDQGIEVVGVGNGEAAVRKVREINPDVILADVFMPVRSGYEVCEFVKNDSRTMHTPVVLLVGAFDPLDEQEAQRVRADGVLKKPFVPPEPLVNMVKALLVKSAGERLVAVAVPSSAASAQAEAATAKTAPPAPEHEFSDDPVEELPLPAPNLNVGEYDKPVAFGSLLEAPAEELPALDENDPIVTSTRDPNLGEPTFWTPPPAAAKESTAELDEPMEHSWGHPESLPGMNDSAVLDPIEPIELDHEAARTRSLEIPPAEEELPIPPQEKAVEGDEKKQPLQGLSLPPIEEPPAVGAPELQPAATVIDWPVVEEAPEFAGSTGAIDAGSAIVSGKADPALEPPIGSEKPSVSASIDPALESTASQTAERQALWNSEAETKVTPGATDTEPAEEFERIPSTWPPPFNPVTTPAGTSQTPVAKVSEPAAGKNIPAPPEVPTLAKNPAETMALEAADLTKATVKEAGGTGSMSPEMIEAVVTRIVERMQPKVLDMVTREILRPVVEALVRREMGKK